MLNERGALVSFDFVIEGYKKRSLPLTWQLIEANGGDVLKENRDITLKPEVTKDSANWAAWVPLPRGHRRRVFIEVHPLRAARRDRNENAAHGNLRYQVSPRFCA